MVEQLGLAIIPLSSQSSISSGFTSGTTKGTASIILKCEVLSITTAPDSTAYFAYFSEILPPAEKKAMSILRPSKTVSVNSSILWFLPLNSIIDPAEFALASGNKFPIGNLTSSKTLKSSSPTAPLAPTTATLYCFTFILLR